MELLQNSGHCENKMEWQRKIQPSDGKRPEGAVAVVNQNNQTNKHPSPFFSWRPKESFYRQVLPLGGHLGIALKQLRALCGENFTVSGQRDIKTTWTESAVSSDKKHFKSLVILSQNKVWSKFFSRLDLYCTWVRESVSWLFKVQYNNVIGW